MKEKVFETKNGVVLYFNTDTNKFVSTDINAVRNALRKDFNDPIIGHEAINLYNMISMLGVSVS
jgi:hypothetical protein